MAALLFCQKQAVSMETGKQLAFLKGYSLGFPVVLSDWLIRVRLTGPPPDRCVRTSVGLNHAPTDSDPMTSRRKQSQRLN